MSKHYTKQIRFTKRVITASILGALFWISFVYLPPFWFSTILLGILIQIIVVEWKNLFSVNKPYFWLIMPLYPILPFALLIKLNHMPEYRSILLLLFIIVSSHDTGSYIFGNLFGRNKIAPAISPKKTWEGFWGGYLSACVALTVLLNKLYLAKPWWFIGGFAFIVCSLALCGDLFESFLKRKARIKDSGDLLPGHGGFLDRFDGIMFAVFFFYFFRHYLLTAF